MLKLKSHTSVKRKLFLVHSNAGKLLWIMGLTTILLELRVRGGGFEPNSVENSGGFIENINITPSFCRFKLCLQFSYKIARKILCLMRNPKFFRV